MLNGKMGKPLLVSGLVAVSLAGCSGSQQGSIDQWMKQEAAQMKPYVEPLPQLQVFPVVAYKNDNMTNPFDVARVVPERVSTGPGPEEEVRQPEPLEAYPLQSLVMIGTLKDEKDGRIHALIQPDASQKVFQVATNNYMGTDYGRIVKIEETQITLRELVADQDGVWVERMTTVSLRNH